MKERKEIVCKVTKNRFNGRTDAWMMNIDYDKMRFNDMLVQDGDFSSILPVTDAAPNVSGGFDDFGIVTQEKQESAENFAKQEINDIVKEDIKKIMEHDSKITPDTTDPFTSDIDSLYKDLGID